MGTLSGEATQLYIFFLPRISVGTNILKEMKEKI